MSGKTTKRMLRAYLSLAMPTLFLSGFFQSPPQNFHNTEEVEIDVTRSGEEVSIAIQSLAAGYRMNDDDLYTNKSFKPPIHKEAVAINSFDLLKRQAGENPFQNPNFRGNLITRVFNAMSKTEAKIRRAIELQASQVLQTGVVTLTDTAGVALYSLDYKPKSTHFPTAGTAWGTSGADPLGDLNALARIIRGNGLASPDTLIMGEIAFNKFIDNADVKARFDNRRYDLGTISPMQIRGEGGEYRGRVEVGNYQFDVWTYNGRYTHPVTGVSTPFIDPANVVMRASSGRLDATFGAIPNIGAMIGNARVLPELPGRFTNSRGGMDLFTNAWLSNDGEQLFAGIGARPLMIPTAIDTFGCLKTGAS